MTPREGEKWKAIALYLADCHAATAEHMGSLSGTSRANRKRFEEICSTALDMISGVQTPHPLSELDVKKRLLEQLKKE